MISSFGFGFNPGDSLINAIIDCSNRMMRGGGQLMEVWVDGPAYDMMSHAALSGSRLAADQAKWQNGFVIVGGTVVRRKE